MKTWKRAVSLFTCAACVLALTGCWNYKDIENMSIAIGAAIDRAEDGQYLLTVELAHPSADSKGLESVLIESEGQTIFDCTRNAVKKLENKLYWAHMQVVVISECVAKEGLLPILDFFVRDTEPRLTIHMMVSKEKTAREILEKPKGLTTTIRSVELESMLHSTEEVAAKEPSPELYRVIDEVCSEGACASLPAVKIVPNADKETTELEGLAVFQHDKLVGYLNDEETKAYLFTTNQIKSGLLTVQVNTPELQRPDITFEIYESQTSVKPVMENGTLHMKVEIKMKVDLGENEAGIDISKKEALDALQANAEASLTQSINNTIQHVQKDYNADIFGFGTKVEEDMPGEWKNIKDNWFNGLYENLQVDVKTKIDIVGSGLLQKPLEP